MMRLNFIESEAQMSLETNISILCRNLCPATTVRGGGGGGGGMGIVASSPWNHRETCKQDRQCGGLKEKMAIFQTLRANWQEWTGAQKPGSIDKIDMGY